MKDYLIIDFETTGLDHTVEQVIEVGAIKYDEHFNQIGSFNSMVRLNPGNELSDFIKELTGITEDLLIGGMQEFEAMDTLDAMIDEETIVVAQYVPFDFAYLANFDIYPKRFICTKSLTQHIDGTKVSSSLGKTAERLGIVLENAHRAMDDVTATKEILKYRLDEEPEYVENFIVERADRAVDMFMPKHTKKFIEVEPKPVFEKN